MRTRARLLAALAGALCFAIASSPAVANSPSADAPKSERGPSSLAPDTKIPHDGRSIVATVVEIDQQARTVTLETPHGPVSLAVTQEVVETLSVGDVVVVRFTDEEDDTDNDYPSASPPLGSQRI
jgi:hypothetical protein